MALSLWLVFPIVAGAAAVDAAMLTQPGHRFMVTSKRLASRRYGWALAWVAVPAVVAHGGVIVAVLALGGAWLGRVGVVPLLLAVAAQAVTIVWFAAWGSLIGRLLSPVVAGIVGAASAFLLSTIWGQAMSPRPQFSVFGDAGASVSQIGVTWNVHHLLVQIAVLGVTAVALWRVRVVGMGTRVRPTVVSACLAVASVMVVGSANSVVGGAPLQERVEAPELCVEAGTTVCVYREHFPYAGDTLETLQVMFDSASAAGYESLVPVRVEEWSRRYEPDRQSGVWGLYTIERNVEVDPAWGLAQSLLVPYQCPALSDDVGPPEQLWQSLEALTYTWMTVAGYDIPELKTTVLEPKDVDRILEAWSRCDLDVSP
jgi:hypothetical protein